MGEMNHAVEHSEKERRGGGLVDKVKRSKKVQGVVKSVAKMKNWINEKFGRNSKG